MTNVSCGDASKGTETAVYTHAVSECSEQGYICDKKLGKNVCSKILKGKYNASLVGSRYYVP